MYTDNYIKDVSKLLFNINLSFYYLKTSFDCYIMTQITFRLIMYLIKERFTSYKYHNHHYYHNILC